VVLDARTGRARLLAELAAYAPADERERAMVERVRAFVAEYEDCFERTQLAGHVTGSAWIVDRAGTAALLLHHRKLGKWLQPGGHADGDPDVRAVALREAQEETCLRTLTFASAGIYDVDAHDIPARDAEPAHVHYDIRFAFRADRDDAPVTSAESHAVAWVPLDEIERRGLDESVLRLARKTSSLSPVSGAPGTSPG
jgi:8-oxo-dGTP pyrophosphatase MutT (NUDIX family)